MKATPVTIRGNKPYKATEHHAAGSIVFVEGKAYVAVKPIPKNAEGEISWGDFNIAKEKGAVVGKQELFWNRKGNPFNGIEGSGALSTDEDAGELVGTAVKDALPESAWAMVNIPE